MADQNAHQNDQGQRQGGYGGSTGGENPMEGKDRLGHEDNTSTGASGRDNPVTSPVDADEALGNRTGAYGGNPASTDDDTEEMGNRDA